MSKAVNRILNGEHVRSVILEGSFSGSNKRLEFEDDLVKVYDAFGKVIYSGVDDYEPMKDAPWEFDKSIGAYRFDSYIKDVQ